ncbi:O-antigen ligase [Pseudarcicella hirudinis]|uniref:O-antigen ligase n=4 Tax=Pseudarcicella hirudinis TaxID=1079859 RepID=A0A1I5YNZ5_9BACT|nr:O-antigen ligase [Pseudarcicella hirudinis]
MRNKTFFVFALIIVLCTERLEKTFTIGFFDLYPSRLLFVMLLPFFKVNLFLKEASKEVKSIFYAFLIYIGCVLMSVFKSNDIFYSFKKWLDVVTINTFVFLVYAFLVKSCRKVTLNSVYLFFLKYFSFVIVIIFIGGLFLYRTTGSTGELEQRTFFGISFYRRISLFNDPNFFSCFLIVAFFIIYFSKAQYRMLLLVLIGISIFITGSKGGIAALLITLILYYRERIPILKSKLFLILLIGMLVSVFAIVMFFPYTALNLLTTLPFFKKEYGAETILPRMIVWHSGMMAFLKEPILGLGPGNIVKIAKGQSIEGILAYMQSNGFYGLQNDVIDKLATHCTYLEILFETGLLSFTFYVLLLYRILKLFLKMSVISPKFFLGYTLAFISFYISILSLSYNTYFMSFLTGMYLYFADHYRKEYKTVKSRVIA